MKEVTTISFQTSSEIKESLEKIAEKENKSVSSLIEFIVYHYLRDEMSIDKVCQNRRRFERKKVTIPAYIGETQWQHDEFIEGKLLDISLGGIKVSIPKKAKTDIPDVHKTEDLCVTFRIPSCYWPIRVKISPQTVHELEDEVQLGASLINPDYQAYSALQKYMM